MKVEQIYTGCLAEAAYYIESNGEVAIIDPLRETKPYIQKATEDNAKIKYVIETHFHADFVSGHIDLAKATGAKIVFGPSAKPNYDAHIATDNEILELGNVKLKVLHTPGHTMESISILLIDENGKNQAIFTGDALFIGDVGRPDLAVKSDLSQEDLAGHLFDSLHNKILPLEDHLTIYPGHGAGSACGKKMSDETTDTLGNQRKTNYALQAMSREEFVKQVIDGLAPPPQYFPKNAVMNKMGYGNFDDVMKKGNVSLSPDNFEDSANANEALILDVRTEEEFISGHIPNSIFIGLDGNFASWVGTLIEDIKQPILLVTSEGQEEEAITRLSRVGYDNTIGFLEGGVKNWMASGKSIETIEAVSTDTFSKLFNENSVKTIDVRRNSEFASEHVIGAENIPMDYINQNMAQFASEDKSYLYCKSGYRSLITISILKSRGIHNLVSIIGGFDALKENSDLKISEYVCPSTLL